MPKGLAHSFFIPYEISRVKIVSDLKRIYIKYQDISIEEYLVYFLKAQIVIKIYFHLRNDEEMMDIHLIRLVNFVTFYLFDYCGEQHVLFG